MAGAACPNTQSQATALNSDSFQMISPHEKKRQAMLAIAKKEEDDYNRYMKEHRIKHVNEIHVLGGMSSFKIIYKSKIFYKYFYDHRW